MALDVRKFGPKSDKIWTHRGAFIYQEPFKKDSSTASRVINEVVLDIADSPAKSLDEAYFFFLGGLVVAALLVALRRPLIGFLSRQSPD
jgi:hypothetical protein